MKKKFVLLVSVLVLAVTAGTVALAASAAVPSTTDLYGCVDGTTRTLEHVYTSYSNFVAYYDAHGCAGGFADVPVPSGSATPSASPTPSTTPTTSPSATPSPTTTATVPAGFSCVTTAVPGGCPATGAYTGYAGFSDFAADMNSGSPYVDQNEWGGVAGQTQELDANSPGDWQVKEMIPPASNPGRGVTTFPNGGMLLDNPAVSAFPDITSTFADAMPGGAGNSGWAAYDIFFNNWGDEEMIQTNFVGNGPCTYAAVQQFAEPGTGLEQTWGLCNFGGPGGEKVWKLAPDGTVVGGTATINETSGAVDITAMTDYLIANGYMQTTTPAATTINGLSAGFEICETEGTTIWSYSDLTFSG